MLFEESLGNASQEQIAQALDAMWRKFLPDNRERVCVLERAAAAARAGNLTGELCAAARSAAHKLAGTLGTFGLKRGTELARSLEQIFQDGVSAFPTAEPDAMAAEIRAIVDGRR